MGKNEFELIFREFVSGFGGEVLIETSDSKIADYIFRTHKIVAELKCLMEDQTKAMNEKVANAVKEWWREGGKIPAGYDSSKPHIHGLVCFSYDSVKSEKGNMNFWSALQLKTDPNEDLIQMVDFQKQLQQAWYAFVEQKWGKKVRQFSAEFRPLSKAPKTVLF